jgi:tripartite-type tricarboxylate transporter receptor subunit TctC
VTSPQRSAPFPELPTLTEAGVAGVEADAWVELIALAATNEAILCKICKEVASRLADRRLF